MTRTRTFRLVAIAVAFAFVLTLAGMPGAAGAAPSRDPKGLRRTASASARRLKGLGSTGLRTGLSALATDDNIPGVLQALPFTVSDTLNATNDTDDVFRVHLNRGDHLVATLTISPTAESEVEVYGPGSTDIFSDEPIAYSDLDTNVLDFHAPADGDYYLDVATFAETWSGSYTLDAKAIPPSPTTITIKTNATSVRIGNIPILSGAVTPFGMVGKNIVAYVMKPGKTYWSYSSNRTVYNLGGKAAWQYKYYFKPGMTKGYYKFKAVAPAPGFASSLGWLTSTSPTIVTIRLW